MAQKGVVEGQKVVQSYLWDGNVLLHEWTYSKGQEAETSVNELGEVYLSQKEAINDLVTWVYQENSFVPSAKIQGEAQFSIISDYIGRPIQCYSENGSLVWSTDYDIYGGLRELKGEKSFIPFRQLGQYEDLELEGLYYNRFRYYDCTIGNYISQDPIGLAGNNPTFYGYVHDSNSWIDPFGLNTFNPIQWTAPSSGTGNTYTVYQQNIDWDKVDPKTGKTNLELASKGRAPLGNDGKSINLHHSKQKAHGPLFEVTASTHTKYGHSNALHPYRVTPVNGSKLNPFDPVNRELFDKDRGEYWKHRAEMEKQRRLKCK
ncbi:HNH/ENDO VII family nuclease [Flavobacterium davisii]|nr:HNH/ENDO VII family nuclease [Flavobacterium davisii]